MIASVIAIAFLGQLRPDTMLDSKHDATFARWVQEAFSQANQWSFVKASELFPSQEMAIVGIRNPPLSQKLRQRKEYARLVLKEAAYKQIREAYDISEKEFRSMIRHPGVASIRLAPDSDARITERIKMRRGIWSLDQTRFDPDKVVIPERIAKAIRYQNPVAKPKPKIEVFSEEAKRNGATGQPTQDDVFTSKKP